jgi:hypothetical protein
MSTAYDSEGQIEFCAQCGAEFRVPRGEEPPEVPFCSQECMDEYYLNGKPTQFV